MIGTICTAIATVNCLTLSCFGNPLRNFGSSRPEIDITGALSAILKDRAKTLESSDTVKIQDESFYLSQSLLKESGFERKNITLPITLVNINDRPALMEENYTFECINKPTERISDYIDSARLNFLKPNAYELVKRDATLIAQRHPKKEVDGFKAFHRGKKAMEEHERTYEYNFNQTNNNLVMKTRFFLNKLESQITFPGNKKVRYYMIKPIEMNYLRTKMIKKMQTYKKKTDFFIDLTAQRKIIADMFCQVFVHRQKTKSGKDAFRNK